MRTIKRQLWVDGADATLLDVDVTGYAKIGLLGREVTLAVDTPVVVLPIITPMEGPDDIKGVEMEIVIITIGDLAQEMDLSCPDLRGMALELSSAIRRAVDNLLETRHEAPK